MPSIARVAMRVLPTAVVVDRVCSMPGCAKIISVAGSPLYLCHLVNSGQEEERPLPCYSVSIYLLYQYQHEYWHTLRSNNEELIVHNSLCMFLWQLLLLIMVIRPYRSIG